VDLDAAAAAEGRGQVQIKETILRNASNNGFDGAFLRFDEGGGVTLVVVEAKHQPSGLSYADFSAVKGERFHTNLAELKANIEKRTPRALGLTAEQKAQVLAALDPATGRVEIQIHTTHETTLGPRYREGSILSQIHEDANHQSRARADGTGRHGESRRRDPET
jgi:hypothetical protein